jgi:hypothetical protein
MTGPGRPDIRYGRYGFSRRKRVQSTIREKGTAACLRKESGMLRGVVSVLLVGAFFLGSAWLTTATAGQPLGLLRSHPFKPGQGAFRHGLSAAPAGAWFYPKFIPELEPWRSGRVGVPSYNWGYFGARTRPSCSRHRSYHGEYIQWTSRRGP